MQYGANEKTESHMPHTITKTVSYYDELGEKAQAKARDWFRSIDDGDNTFADVVIEDAVRMGEILGFDFKTHSVRLMGGDDRQEPNVWWSLSYSQGDYAAFDASYTFAPDAVAKITEATGGNDAELIRIATELTALQGELNGAFTATVEHNPHYGLRVETFDATTDEGAIQGISVPQLERFKEAMRDFASWIYDAIRKEHEWRTADEQIAEDIRANEYEFTEDGRRAS